MKPATYTIAEVSELLKVSTFTVRREIEEGRMPTVPFAGRVVRVPAIFIEEMLRSVARSVS